MVIPLDLTNILHLEAIFDIESYHIQIQHCTCGILRPPFDAKGLISEGSIRVLRTPPFCMRERGVRF